jgi:hypothetical protein
VAKAPTVKDNTVEGNTVEVSTGEAPAEDRAAIAAAFGIGEAEILATGWRGGRRVVVTIDGRKLIAGEAV